MKQTSKSRPSEQVEDAFASFRSMVAMVPRMQASAAALILKQQKELFEFFAHRCTRDLEFVERLRQTEDVSKLPDLFSKFVQGASQDYSDETRKCVDAGSHAATELTQQLQELQPEKPKIAA